MLSMMIFLFITSILNIKSYYYDFDLENGVTKWQTKSLQVNNTYRFYV